MGELAAMYRLVELTKEELKVQTKVDDFEMWGAPALTKEQYQKKEALQRATAFSQRGSIFWALVGRVQGDDSSGDASDAAVNAGKDLIYCHCESHRFDCVFRNRKGEIVHGFSHHIGSVFTLPSHRKNGLASFFLTEIAKSMAKRPNAVASVLYSDIGPTYYDKLGWRLHPSTIAELNVAAARNTAAIETGKDASTGTKLFLDQELDAFLAQDNRCIVDEMSGGQYDGKEVFAALPTRDSIEWQFCIGVHYANIRGFKDLPSQCGLKLDNDAFVVWCHNLKESTLYIVRARFPKDASRHDAVLQLLRAALVEAKAFQLDHVAIWDPPSLLFAPEIVSKLDVVKEERQDSLSSAMIFAQHRGGQASAAEGNAALPIWIANEKFAWV
uniref:LYC1 C-terminal domain-containing protein n=1 Tax=Globisporangium ultimum (strain ATCC 200006 / CBS 805.95 / DAOM BR144) TaxID=431595 RepID=K3WEX0_GLOUD